MYSTIDSVDELIPKTDTIDELIPTTYTINYLISTTYTIDYLIPTTDTVDLISTTDTVDDLIPTTDTVDDLIPTTDTIDELIPTTDTVNTMTPCEVLDYNGYRRTVTTKYCFVCYRTTDPSLLHPRRIIDDSVDYDNTSDIIINRVCLECWPRIAKYLGEN
jgi:hypothetical protein